MEFQGHVKKCMERRGVGEAMEIHSGKKTHSSSSFIAARRYIVEKVPQ